MWHRATTLSCSEDRLCGLKFQVNDVKTAAILRLHFAIFYEQEIEEAKFRSTKYAAFVVDTTLNSVS
jgi:hypothetical protein